MIDRRAFLTLIASAPLAALAPWPKVLELTNANWNIVRDRQTGIAIRFVREWDAGVVATPIRLPRPYVSLPRTVEEKRATEMVNAARARFLAGN